MSTEMTHASPVFESLVRSESHAPSGAAVVAREAQEVQAAIVAAKRFPRDQKLAFDRIMQACDRVSLAEQAMYSYTRGGQEVTGPSIRLAETIAQAWGNIQFGFAEVEQVTGASEVIAYCWDVETNTRRAISFKVQHVRDTKKGSYTLTNARDVYELVANQASRRVRNCVLAVIPGDVVEAAIARCERTLTSQGEIEKKRANVAKAFADLGVTQDDIERRLGKRLDAMSHVDYLSLRKIYASLKDGMSEKSDWFEDVADPKKILREQEAAGKEGAPAMQHEKRAQASDLEAAQRAFEDAVAAARLANLVVDDVLKGRFVEVNTSMNAVKLRAATTMLTNAVKKATETAAQ